MNTLAKKGINTEIFMNNTTESKFKLITAPELLEMDIPGPEREWIYQKSDDDDGSPFWDSYLHRCCTEIKRSKQSPWRYRNNGR